MSIEWRWYQVEAVQAFFKYFYEGKTGNPLICLPTGTGKSLIIAKIIMEIITHWPTQRVLMLTHVKELIRQDVKALLSIWPAAPYGIYSAGLNRRDTVHPIIFGGVASVNNAVKAFGHRDLVFIDEAHLLSPDEGTMYRKIINKLMEVNPHLKVIGFTATWYRLGQGLLTDNGIFTDIIYNICNPDGFGRLISEGYLSPLIPKRTQIELRTEGVKIQGGDFVQKQLEAAVNIPSITREALKELIYYGETKRKWLNFCSGIDHAEAVAEGLRMLGYPAEALHSKLPAGKSREGILRAYETGELRAVCTNNLMTTGYDNSEIDLIGMFRPTVSPSLWVQMLGRGTRPFYLKHDCLVLDFARNTVRLGPIDDPRIPRPPGDKGGEMPVKICPECDTFNHVRVEFCICCGHKFEFEQKIVQQADTAPLLSQAPPIIEFFDVWSVIYSRHIGKKTQETFVKITYYTVSRSFSDFLTFDIPGVPRYRAEQWWAQHMGTPCPLSTDMALEQIKYSRKPKRIRVWVNKPGKFPQVMGHEF